MQPPKLSNVRSNIEDITPLHDFVLIRRSPADERYGRILLPNGRPTHGKDSGLKRGIVVAVGRGDKFTERHGSKSRKRFEGERLVMDVQPGDEVIWTRTPANNCIVDGAEYVFVHEELIYGVIEKEAA